MAIDVARFLRLRGAIRSTLAGFEKGTSVAQGVAAPEAYVRFRDETRLLIFDSDVEEFERLFPPWTRGTSASIDPATLGWVEDAKALLSQLQGWLEGFIEAAEWERDRDR